MSAKRIKPLLPVDDSVTVPPAVRAAAAAADALHKQIYAAPDPAPADPAAVDPAPVEQPPAPLAAAPVEPIVTPVGNEPAPPVDPAPAPAPSEQSWEHRYNSMKGRWERSEAANRQLTERLNGLEQVVATMAVTAPIPTAPTPAELTAASLITPEERAVYGDEFITVAGKAAEEKWSPVVQSLQAEVKNLRERLEGVGTFVGQTQQDRMHEYLTMHCPNWLEVNNDPKFLQWLSLPEPYSGAIKDKILQAAYAANDAPRVLAFFKGFLSEEAALAPRSEPTPPPAPAADKVPLEAFAAPGRAKTAAAPPVPAEKPIFTRAQVTAFYVDVNSKKYAGREDEKNRLEQQIIEAGRDGRIR